MSERDVQTKAPLSVLLVDDDKTIVNIFQYGLGEQGYEVHIAYTAAEALRICKAIKIDCLLSDIQLPDQDGMRLNAIIQEIYPDVISILMTGYPGISSAIKGLRQNIHDYLIKPFSVEQAIAAIERALNNDRLRRTNHALQQKIETLETELTQLKEQVQTVTEHSQNSQENKMSSAVNHARAHKSYLEQQGRLKQ